MHIHKDTGTKEKSANISEVEIAVLRSDYIIINVISKRSKISNDVT